MTADTVVSVGRRILHKVTEAKQAEEYLKLISGRRHKVLTTFCLFSPDNQLKIKTVQSVVKFKRLNSKELYKEIKKLILDPKLRKKIQNNGFKNIKHLVKSNSEFIDRIRASLIQNFSLNYFLS